MHNLADPESFYIRLPQDIETPETNFRVGPFDLLWAYARSADTQRHNAPGEDFLTFVADQSTLIFAVCDGVGQSFIGRLAACFVGDRLVEWLYEASDITLSTSETKFASELGGFLQELVIDASEEIKAYQLTTPVLSIREVLEHKRLAGSEAMFVCGRLDLPTPDHPQGRVNLAWLGNMRLGIWRNADHPIDLGDRFHNKERWSTHLGVVGKSVNVWMGPLLGVEGPLSRLLVYSDGLALLDSERNTRLEPSRLTELIARSATLPVSDDITVLEVNLMLDTILVKNGDPLRVEELNSLQRSRERATNIRPLWVLLALLILSILAVGVMLARNRLIRLRDTTPLPTAVPTAAPLLIPTVPVTVTPENSPSPTAQEVREPIDGIYDLEKIFTPPDVFRAPEETELDRP